MRAPAIRTSRAGVRSTPRRCASGMMACSWLLSPRTSIHHGKGEHTFEASRGVHHREIQLASLPLRELQEPEFIEDTFHLGDITLDNKGCLFGSDISLKLLNYKEKQRRALLAVLRLKGDGSYVDNKILAKALDITVPTLRKWMKPLERAGDVKKQWSYWRIKIEI